MSAELGHRLTAWANDYRTSIPEAMREVCREAAAALLVTDSAKDAGPLGSAVARLRCSVRDGVTVDMDPAEAAALLEHCGVREHVAAAISVNFADDEQKDVAPSI